MKPLLPLLLLLSLSLSLHAETPAQHVATKPQQRPEPNAQARHEKFNEISKKGEAQLVFLGDSITQGWEGAGKEAWAKHFAPLNAAGFGIGGDRTEHVLWRLENGNFDGLKPKLIVLMIGTNNTGHYSAGKYESTPKQTAEGIKLILEKLKAKTPESKILVLGVFPRGATATDAYRQKNDAINSIIKGYADDKSVYFLNINDKFLEPDGTLSKTIMPDLLHLSPAGYEIWAEAIEGKVKELMK